MLAGCDRITGPSLDCQTVIRGKLVGVINYTDGHADTLRANPKVWADTLTKCETR